MESSFGGNTVAGAVGKTRLASLRSTLKTLALPILLTTMAWCTVVVGASSDWRQSREAAERDVQAASRIYAEHVQKIVDGADQTARFLRSEYVRTSGSMSIDDYVSNSELISKDFQLMSIIGADGYVALTAGPPSHADLREREHFRFHAAGATDRLFVSKPVLGKVSGKWSIQVTRRIASRDGAFAGVAVVSLAPSVFTNLFDSIDLGRDGMFAVYGFDGFGRLRATKGGVQLATDVRASAVHAAAVRDRSGEVRAAGVVDGIDRYYAFRELPGTGLYVLAGMSTVDMTEQARRRLTIACAAAAVVTAISCALGFSIYRRQQRQVAADKALRDSVDRMEELLRVMASGAGEVALAGDSMSVGAQSLAIHTDQQNTSLAEASGAIVAVTQRFQACSANISDVDRQCAELRSGASSGVVVAAHAVGAMRRIDDSARAIVEAISLIDAVALQTNLLALNATIEAAHAGPAGRGFAVVANEVRALAARTATSATEVRRLIERTVAETATGMREIDAVREVLEQVTGRIDDVARATGSVAVAVRTQSNELDLVLAKLESLSRLTNDNAELVAGAVMTADAMQSSAGRLSALVQRMGQPGEDRDLRPPSHMKAPARHVAAGSSATSEPTPASSGATPSLAGSPSGVEFF